MEPECSSPHSELSATCLYPEPNISPRPRLCLWIFRNKDPFSQWKVVSPSPNPQAGGPPLVGCPRMLIQYIRSWPPYWRPFLRPQTVDAPCRGDRDPLITWRLRIFGLIFLVPTAVYLRPLIFWGVRKQSEGITILPTKKDLTNIHPNLLTIIKITFIVCEFGIDFLLMGT
jgi:hypothetical protein